MTRTLNSDAQQVAALATVLLLATAHERRIWRGHRNGALAILRASRRGGGDPRAAVEWLVRALWEIEATTREWEGEA